MKVTLDNQRQKNNIAGANHNDRTMEDLTRKKRDHIDWERTSENRIMVRVEGENFDISQSTGELARFEMSYYSGTYTPSVETQKQKYLKNRQKKRAEECTIEKLYNAEKTGVQKTLLQVGKEGEYEDRAKFEKMCMELADYFETQKGEDYRHTVLSMSFHYDETSIHCHMNHVYEVKDENGNWKPAKDEFLKRMKIELPKKEEKKSKKNNRAQVMIAQDREKWQDIVETIDKEVSIDRVPEKRRQKQKMDHELGKATQITNKAIEKANAAIEIANEYEERAKAAKSAYLSLLKGQEKEYAEFNNYKENKAEYDKIEDKVREVKGLVNDQLKDMASITEVTEKIEKGRKLNIKTDYDYKESFGMVMSLLKQKFPPVYEMVVKLLNKQRNMDQTINSLKETTSKLQEIKEEMEEDYER